MHLAPTRPAVLGSIVCLVLAAPVAAGPPSFRLTLSDRLRGELVDWFEPEAGRAPEGAERYAFFANQLRVGASVSIAHLRVLAEVQDTRLVSLPDDASLPAPEGNLGPGALYFFHTHDRDQGEPFLRQGFLELGGFAAVPGGTLAAGRFEHADGLESVPADAALAWLKRTRIAERLVGPFGYTHVARTFDGVRAVLDRATWNLTALAARPTHGGFEVSANRELEDVGLAGLAVTGKPGALDDALDLRGFYLYYEDRRPDAVKVDNRPLEIRRADRDDVFVHTFGGHAISVLDAGPGRVDGLLWGAVQTGDFGALDHRAWAYAFEAGYQLPRAPAAPWIRAGYDVSSGDDDPADGDHRTFFQVLPTARVYAQFPFFNMMNVADFFAQAIVKPHPRVQLRTDWHWLRLVEERDLWYAGGGATNAQVFGFSGLPSSGRRELAHLVDASAAITLTEQLRAYAYYGHAFGQGVVKGTFGGESADYGYVEMSFRY